MALDLFYWNDRPNWGDQLSPLLTHHFTGRTVQWAPPSLANAVVVGSILDVLPRGWHGVIAGAGKLLPWTDLSHLQNVRILGVRGKLTAASFPSFPYKAVLGDPALLADELVTPLREPVFDLGIVPHWTDHTLVNRFIHLAREFEVVVIPSSTPPFEAIETIGKCRKIVSSSLHGIIVADAFGIPRRAERFPAMISPYEGGEFKFHDHGTALGQPILFGQVQIAPRERVEQLQVGLFEMFKRLREESWD